MERFEMAERLSQKAGVSLEEARNALEQNDWDLLDALVALESQGKLNREGRDSYTTKKEPQPQRQAEEDLRGTFTKVFSYLADLIDKANKINLVVSRNGKTVLAMPLTVLILLLVFMFWWVLPLMVVGLFFGFRYSFSGHKAADAVNKAMDKAAQTAENIRDGFARDEAAKDKPE